MTDNGAGEKSAHRNGEEKPQGATPVPPVNAAASPVPGNGACAEISKEVPAQAPIAAPRVNGKFPPGVSGNPKGRPPGIPNKNTEFLKLLTSKELREVWALAKAQAKKGENGLLEFLLDRAFLKQTPEAAGIAIYNNPQAIAQNHETHVRIGEHLADAGTRDAVAELTQRLAARGAFAG